MDLKIVHKSLMIIDLSNKDLNKKMTSLNRVKRETSWWVEPMEKQQGNNWKIVENSLTFQNVKPFTGFRQSLLNFSKTCDEKHQRKEKQK